MGWFGGKKEKEVDEELENAHKYVETILCNSRADLDKEIAKRIEAGRIIQKIDYEMNLSNKLLAKEDKEFEGNIYSALIMYDAWAEKARTDKEKGLGLGR
ncbi:MAG: hypothetical protein KGV57_04880 [Fusobacterium sp.]|nr:hypothetical protein [Fusobacterium sp.]